jgi:hypothetical protein
MSGAAQRNAAASLTMPVRRKGDGKRGSMAALCASCTAYPPDSVDEAYGWVFTPS